jgi:RNA polymerase sigma-70 factor (ECF subfamily)
MTALTERTPTTTTAQPPSSFTDEYLMVLIQSHGHHGLGLLYDRYARLLKVLSMKVLHNDADAEDLVQDVFLEIWDRAASYDPLKGKALSWIATLTRRRSIDRLRKRETYCRVEDRFAEETKSHSDGWTHVHEDLALGEMNEYLQRALATLPEAQRHAIKLAYQRQMTQREIAVHTGIPLGTIKTRLELGLKKLAVSLCGFEDLLWAGHRAPTA